MSGRVGSRRVVLCLSGDVMSRRAVSYRFSHCRVASCLSLRVVSRCVCHAISQVVSLSCRMVSVAFTRRLVKCRVASCRVFKKRGRATLILLYVSCHHGPDLYHLTTRNLYLKFFRSLVFPFATASLLGLPTYVLQFRMWGYPVLLAWLSWSLVR